MILWSFQQDSHLPVRCKPVLTAVGWKGGCMNIDCFIICSCSWIFHPSNWHISPFYWPWVLLIFVPIFPGPDSDLSHRAGQADLKLAEFRTEISYSHKIAPVPPTVSYRWMKRQSPVWVMTHNMGTSPMDPRVLYKSQILKEKTHVTGFSELSKYPGSTHYNGC